MADRFFTPALLSCLFRLECRRLLAFGRLSARAKRRRPHPKAPCRREAESPQGAISLDVSRFSFASPTRRSLANTAYPHPPALHPCTGHDAEPTPSETANRLRRVLSAPRRDSCTC